jgi:hypothetical protein
VEKAEEEEEAVIVSQYHKDQKKNDFTTPTTPRHVPTPPSPVFQKKVKKALTPTSRKTLTYGKVCVDIYQNKAT